MSLSQDARGPPDTYVLTSVPKYSRCWPPALAASGVTKLHLNSVTQPFARAGATLPDFTQHSSDGIVTKSGFNPASAPDMKMLATIIKNSVTTGWSTKVAIGLSQTFSNSAHLFCSRNYCLRAFKESFVLPSLSIGVSRNRFCEQAEISRGASVIVCWYPNYNSSSWYGLRLKSKAPLLPWIRSTNDEESQLSEPAMLAVRKSRCRKHHPPRFLQDHVREASPIPMPDLPEDILFKHSYPVLSTPTQARNL